VPREPIRPQRDQLHVLHALAGTIRPQQDQLHVLHALAGPTQQVLGLPLVANAQRVVRRRRVRLRA